MKNIKYILIFAVLIVSGKLTAQQYPSYSLYKYNMNVVNPAYAGVNGYTELNINFRSQWINLPESPETQSFFFSKPINDKIGVGLSIVNDKVDILKQTSYVVDFSYKVKVSEKSNLFLGLKAGGYSFNADFLSKNIPDPAFSENVNRFNPVFGAGAYYEAGKFYATISVPNLLKGKRVAKNNELYVDATDEAHFFAGAGYELNVNENIKFLPSFLGRFVQGAPASIDITGMFDIYNKIELGGSYRVSESFSAIMLLKLADWLHLGYAYESTVTDVRTYADGSHEVMLRFNLNEI